MYTTFYGLREKPFELLPDPEYLYMSRGHDDAYAHLEYAVGEAKGFVVVTGEIGAGKTTLINRLLQRIPQGVEAGVVNNTALPPSQFLKAICQEFELPTNGLDRVELLDQFNEYLINQYTLGKRVVLIVDEAQNLPTKTIEEIRLLSNLEAEKHHLIQIILIGQPDLRKKLRARELRQFVQRVTVHCHLQGLAPDEVKGYVLHRLKVAGGHNTALFQDDALEAIGKYSRGIPRLINLLGDLALVYGFAEELPTIDKRVVEEVIETRASGGLLTEGFQKEEESAPEARVASTPDAKMNDRLDLAERKLKELALAVDEIQRQIDSLARADHQIVDAFETLMRRTNKELAQVAALIQSRFGDRDAGRDPLELVERENTSLISRRRRR